MEQMEGENNSKSDFRKINRWQSEMGGMEFDDVGYY